MFCILFTYFIVVILMRVHVFDLYIQNPSKLFEPGYATFGGSLLCCLSDEAQLFKSFEIIVVSPSL